MAIDFFNLRISSKNNFFVNKFYSICIALSIFISLDEFVNSYYLG